jgi:hypothetical protein
MQKCEGYIDASRCITTIMYSCMPAPHAFFSKMLAERTASRNVKVIFYFIFILRRLVSLGIIPMYIVSTWCIRDQQIT